MVLTINTCNSYVLQRRTIQMYIMILYSVGTDPCEDGAQYCDDNADCVTRGDQYQCQCRPGYVGDGRTCGGKS